MSKRFIIDDDGLVVDKSDLSIYMDNEDCCEKLNELADEIKELEHRIQETDNQLEEYMICVDKKDDQIRAYKQAVEGSGFILVKYDGVYELEEV